MSTVIISSTEDPASTNIKKSLIKKSTWDEIGPFFDIPVLKHTSFSDLYLVTIPDRTIFHENIEQEIIDKLNIQPTKAIYISRHSSKSGEPTLTTHPIGNYGKALFGGKDKTLTPALPHLMTHLLRFINKKTSVTNLEHKVCFEVTHHGPYLSIPTLYVEVGSTEDEWVKEKPAGIIADSLLDLFYSFNSIIDSSNEIPILVGIGGGHYAPRLTDVALEKNVAFGHMIPTYHINDGNIDTQMIQKAISASGNVHGVYIHRKALKKSQQTTIKNMCSDIDIPVVSSNDFSDIS